MKVRATAAAIGGTISEDVGFIDWREATTEQAISITQQAIAGLATCSLATAA
jgi:hypothetical protein